MSNLCKREGCDVIECLQQAWVATSARKRKKYKKNSCQQAQGPLSACCALHTGIKIGPTRQGFARSSSLSLSCVCSCAPTLTSHLVNNVRQGGRQAGRGKTTRVLLSDETRRLFSAVRKLGARLTLTSAPLFTRYCRTSSWPMSAA